MKPIRTLVGAAAAAVLLVACGGGNDPSGNGLTDAQIEALALGKAKSGAATGRPDLLGLEPLAAADVADPGLRGGCALLVANERYLVSGPWAAVAKRNGRVQTLQVNGPVSQAGAFFETEVMSISIGQPRSGPSAEAAPPGAARARINDRRMGTSIEVAGTWVCGG